MKSNSHFYASNIGNATWKTRSIKRCVSDLLLAGLTFSMSLSAQVQVIELRSPTDQAGAYFGSSMLGLADLTGDGIGELAVGAFAYGDGAVFVLNGRDFTLIRTITSPEPLAAGDSGHFGWSLDTTPDTSGDGIPELIVGAIYADRPDLRNSGFGQAYVIDPITGQELQTFSAPRPERATQFGWNVASLSSTTAGEVTRIAVGAPAGSVGRVHLYNSASGELSLSFRAPTPRSGDWFGTSLAAIHDIDGDGRVDLAVGAGSYDGESGSAGGAYLVSGETGHLIHQLIPPDLPAITRHRWAVAAVPDINGDGKTDVLVGVPLASPAGAVRLAGRAYLFNGANGEWLRTIVSPEPQLRGFFGWAVAGLPDITGDGVAELLIAGAGRPAIGSLGERRMHLISGATGQRIQSFQSPADGEAFGASIAGVLDRTGKLRAVASGSGVAALPPAPNRAGRGYAFPLSLSFVSASKSDAGVLLSLSATDERDYELQSTLDLKTWTIIATVKGAAEPVTFLDRESNESERRFYRAKVTKTPP